MTDTDMLYMASLEKRNAELEAKVAELESKHWNECGQIAHYSDELRRAKELLKAAIKDIGDMSRYCLGMCCDSCPQIHTLSRGYQSCIWQHEAEALALIGEDTNVPVREDGEQNG